MLARVEKVGSAVETLPLRAQDVYCLLLCLP